MSNDYAREILRRTVAQTCQMIGWQGINSTPLDILVHILEKYILTLGTQTHRYAEQFNRADPNLHDLGLTFRDIHVQLPELREYTRCVPSVSCQLNVPKFPLPKDSHLNFLKPGSQEVVTRPVHVHEYLPAMYPEKEKESTPPVADVVEIVQNGMDGDVHAVDRKSPEISVTDISEKPRDLFKRPIDPVSITPPGVKKPRLKLEEEDCQTREISSVMMTMSGFLSPAREGKLPEARTPIIVPDVPPEKVKNTQHYNPVSLLPPVISPVARPDKKVKRGKTLNGKIEKAKKKEKVHKNVMSKQMNSENRVNKLAMHLARGKVRPSSSKHHTSPKPPLKQLSPVAENYLKGNKTESSKLVKPNITPLEPSPAPPPLAKVHKSPLVPHHNPNAISDPPPPNIVIKEEKLENDYEKLTSQPDRSKLNIFKKISTKVKEEKSHDQSFDRYHDNGAVKFEKPASRCSSPGLIIDETDPKHKHQHQQSRVKEANDFIASNSAVDLSSKKSVPSEVIHIDDDSNDLRRHVFKSEPIDDYPKDLSKPKLNEIPRNLFTGPAVKEKKERKRKERKVKPNKAMKELAKMMKKQQQQDKYKYLDYMDPTMHSIMPPMFPYLPPLVPGQGLIPGLIPGGGLFSNSLANPALRGIPSQDPNILPNPFSFGAGGAGLLSGPNVFLPSGPGLIPPGLSNPMMSHLSHSFGQSPRMPTIPLPSFLRRPSLEVIPLDDDNEIKTKGKQPFLSPPIAMKERDKTEKQKISAGTGLILNTICSAMSSPVKQSSPKPNPVIKMPPIKPDVTIKLNPPEKQKIIEPKIEPPVVDESPPPPPPPPPPVPPPPPPPTKEKGERKKDKLHKKEKKDKEQKVKKKKDKKDKIKKKIEKKKEKDDRHENKEKLKKEKKEKRKDKDKEKIPAIAEGLIPKLTLKLGPPSPMLPPSPDNARRLNIKPVVKKDEGAPPPPPDPEPVVEERLSVERSQSPELARISALVTRPPKSKASNKHSPAAVKTEPAGDLNKSLSPPPQPQPSDCSPARKSRPPTTFSKYKRIYFKPIPKRGSLDDSAIDVDAEEGAPKELTPVDNVVPKVKLGTPFYMDPQGNKVWICPACGRPDNGSPMIGCDGCDGWYHWVCVGIRIAPDDSEDWYCTSCFAKRTAMASALAAAQTGKKRGRKPKADKLKENH